MNDTERVYRLSEDYRIMADRAEAAEAERDKLLALLREAKRVMGNAALDDWTCQNDPDLEKDWNNLLSHIDAALCPEKPPEVKP